MGFVEKLAVSIVSILHDIYPKSTKFVEKTDGTSLDDAKSEMMAKISKGTKCPCCSRFVKRYNRKLHAEMAVFLIKLVKAYEKEQRWYTTVELQLAPPKSSTDGAYLVHWGLLERKPGKNDAGGRAGLYRPTNLGIAFAHGDEEVDSHIQMLCGNFDGFSKRQKKVSIQHCLGDKFDYEELMQS